MISRIDMQSYQGSVVSIIHIRNLQRCISKKPAIKFRESARIGQKQLTLPARNQQLTLANESCQTNRQIFTARNGL